MPQTVMRASGHASRIDTAIAAMSSRSPGLKNKQLKTLKNKKVKEDTAIAAMFSRSPGLK
jgi:hypothetical protein